jgi:hypothetical protein
MTVSGCLSLSLPTERHLRDSTRSQGAHYDENGPERSGPGAISHNLAMQAPRRRRPLRREVVTPAGIDLNQLAARATYVGSPEHKSTRSFAGHPRPRATATICDPKLADSQVKITDWLRDAIRHGQVSGVWDGEFPKYVWGNVDGQLYEGRLVNREQGQYKGYPLLPVECPKGLVFP